MRSLPAGAGPGPGPGAGPGTGLRVVALGGGHGLFASLSALRRVSDRLTAVVTVADDGGIQRQAPPRPRRAAAR